MDLTNAGKAVRVANTEIPVHRILGRNPGPMTGPGTNSYLIGSENLCLLDPGPRDEAQFENFIAAIGDRELAYILITHTHGDHSPGALKLAERTGAELVGIKAPESGSHDLTFKPSKLWAEGDIIDCGEYRIRLIQTPGHVSNHICFLIEEEGLLFTGDHVLQGTTSVILPPDGNMAHYLNSLDKLLHEELRYLAPGHGEIMDNPHHEIRELIAHRLKREEKVLVGLHQLGQCDLDELVMTVYDDIVPQLIPWAKKTLTAHLIKLQDEGRVNFHNDQWKAT